MSEERVARATGAAALKDDPGRTELDWPHISYPDANGGLDLMVLARAAIEAMTVWVYQSKELKVFATAEAAQAWFDKNDPEGVAFEYEIIGAVPA